VEGDVKVKVGDTIVKIDPKYFRPTEVELLIGDPTKAKEKLGWELEYDLDALIDDMVNSDRQLFMRDKYLHEGGHKIFQYHE
jgi:GDPmannose 4,6-dehydratase